MSPQVSVIILNWNGRSLLAECLAALRAQTWRDFEIIVVDNGSQDDSVQWLSECEPDVRVICNATNLGFATANNQGILLSQAPVVMLLNNDAILEPDCLQALMSAADEHTEAGALACKILIRGSKGQMDSAGIEVDRAGIAWNRGWGKPAAEYTKPVNVFGPSAAAALYRRSMLEQIGLLDDDFFIYYEDVDLAWRAQWAGWPCVYVPNAVVHHVHSATTGRNSPFKNYLLSRNKWWAIFKNYPIQSLVAYLPLVFIIDLGAMLWAIWRTRNLSPLRGRWAAVRGMRKIWHKRREIQRPVQGMINWRETLVPIRLSRI